MKLESMSALNTIASLVESPRPITPPWKVTLPTNVDAPPTLKSPVTFTLVIVAAAPIISVMIPTVILALTASRLSASIVVIVAALPTISVTATPVMFIF